MDSHRQSKGNGKQEHKRARPHRHAKGKAVSTYHAFVLRLLEGRPHPPVVTFHAEQASTMPRGCGDHAWDRRHSLERHGVVVVLGAEEEAHELLQHVGDAEGHLVAGRLGRVVVRFADGLEVLHRQRPAVPLQADTVDAKE